METNSPDVWSGSRRNRIGACRICGERTLIPLLDLGEQALTGVFPLSPADPVSMGPLALCRCDSLASANACGLVQLENSFDGAEMYGDGYGYRSSLNRSMVDHLRAKAQQLSAIVPLSPGDVVLDIGSNDGTSLSFYPPFATRIGIDPVSAKFLSRYEDGIIAVPDFFTAEAFRARVGDKKAKIVTSIAMFYDLDDPKIFVEDVADILDEDGIWHLEQSYLPSMMAANAYDTICHEHAEYYTLRQIEWLCARYGLRVIDVSTNLINGGSFAVTICRAGSSLRSNTPVVDEFRARERALGLDSPVPYEHFASRVERHRADLVRTVNALTSAGKRVLGYGASTKGNVLLQYCGFSAAQIPAIADVNPDKYGHVTPGTHIPIVSEDDARIMRPDYFLVLPWHFRENIVGREAAFLSGGGKLLFPLPEISIVER